jgi:hypothetical protein
VIHYGMNSGYQAINLAYLMGATHIVLLGYDMQPTGGKQHWFGEHPDELRTGPLQSMFAPKFVRLALDLEAAGIRVTNCTRETALTCFKRASLQETLASLSAQGRASTSMPSSDPVLSSSALTTPTRTSSVQRSSAIKFGVNNTHKDIELDVWIACDPKWHDHYGQVEGDFEKWHWDQAICDRYGYQFIEGRWGDGLSLNPEYIHYGHSSGYQALNLAVLYGCNPIYLVGYDMHYNNEQRHYFNGLSDSPGEYPADLRKWSTFDGLLKCYETIASQPDLPTIINCSPGSAMTCFPMGELPDG